jgi:pimeloyl-ACP methyl ester carboxylesterase
MNTCDDELSGTSRPDFLNRLIPESISDPAPPEMGPTSYGMSAPEGTAGDSQDTVGYGFLGATMPINDCRHGMAEIEPGIRLHYVVGGRSTSTVVLMHGFPQTWWEWRHVIPGLLEAGFQVVAPDYRGAGHSWRPAAGYDKQTMARDIRALVRQHLEIHEPVALVGHDIGLMVAYAYAQGFRDEVSRLIVIDAPIPGTSVFDRLRSDPRVWHFAFHGARDIAEMLVSGRERQYLQAFFNVRIGDPSAISEEDFDHYVSAYQAPGAMRAGFELYRAFDQDADDNRASLERNGKLNVPVLAIGGKMSTSGILMESMMREVAGSVESLVLPRTAHWIPEEQPTALTSAMTEFLRPAVG